MKPSQLSAVLDIAIENRHPLLIVGPPGIGKSDMVEQSCDRTGAKLAVFHPVVSDPTDFKGLPFAQNGEAEFLPFGELKNLINAKEPTVAFLDDLGQAPPSVQAAAMQLLLSRKINGHKISDEVTFIAATNRREDRAGVQGILEPVKSRFLSLVHMDTDLEDWVDWANRNNLPRELIAFIRARPNLLHDFRPSKGMVNTSCPRTVAFVGKILQGGYPEESIHEMIAGACGEAFLVEFAAFKQLEDQIPDPETILRDPENSPVPEDPAILYALCTALAQTVREHSIDSLMIYLDRLPAEFSTLTIKDCLGRNKKLGETDAIINWSVRHQDRLMEVA